MDLFLDIKPNPNCETTEGMLYQALEPPQVVAQMRVQQGGRDRLCWVTGVEPGPRWVPAQARKITDSGAGVAYCIYGGRWGLRFQPADAAQPGPWDLADRDQWGEPYKVYGDPNDFT